ncbi:MAG: FAD:protein FMN transferase [Coriobacteriia bacterium]
MSPHMRKTGPRPRIAAPLILVLVSTALLATGCSRLGLGRAPATTVSRSTLGTVVTITVYGRDRAAVSAVVDRAFRAIDVLDRELDPYTASSMISRFNADPYAWQRLPAGAVTVFDEMDRLGVGGAFVPTLWGATRLYDFGGTGSVPDPGELRRVVAASGMFERRGASARFRGAPDSESTSASLPGIDLGGAVKGLAIERAGEIIGTAPSIDGALLSAGSTVLAVGRKPGGAWRIGIEDPREPARIVAVVKGTTTLGSVSTSGDYQLGFVRDGVRYHHILDPRTGKPVRGLRSLTVAGAMSALDSDILSTALFVMGVEKAHAYARDHGLALYTVDDEGHARITPAPPDERFVLETVAEPRSR